MGLATVTDRIGALRGEMRKRGIDMYIVPTMNRNMWETILRQGVS